MRKRYRKLWLYGLSSIGLLLVAGFALFCLPRIATAHAPVMEITSAEQLRAFGVPDAVLIERYADEADGRKYLLYRSEQTGYDYHFDAETGDLTEISRTDSLGLEAAPEMAAGEAAVSDAERHKIAIDFAEKYIAPYQIGELVLELDHFTDSYYFINLAEEYNGERTGTNVFLTCLPDGSVVSCLLFRGSIFGKDETGSPTVSDPRPLIGEEAAIAAARTVAEARIAEDGGVLDEASISCTLRAHKEKRYYLVTLTIGGIWFENYGEAVDSDYTIQIDAYTGAVLDAAKTI